MSGFDWESVKRQFPSLDQEVQGHPLTYLDNAATSHKPAYVIDAVAAHYREDCSNIHRGVHELSQRATRAFEEARKKVQRFIGAASDREVIFTRGTTESINLVAQTFGRSQLKEGDEIVLTGMEHHSNIVPWQLLAQEKGLTIRVVPVLDDGTIDLNDYEALLTDRTRLVAVIHTSNAMGTINPAQEMIRLAHGRGVPVLLDGAQAVPHGRVDVQSLDCDFFVFSGHKLYGPTGIGVLYGKEALLEAMPPWQGGGDMIRSVSFDGTTYADLPSKFEAGTPHIAGAIGLGAAVDWMMDIGPDAIGAWEHELLVAGTERLQAIPGLRIIGTGPRKVGVLSFVIDGLHPHDIGTVLDMQGVAVRTGHHCAEPLMRRFEIAATTRASFAAYNSMEDIDRLVAGIEKAKRLFS
jgi:cysteine desulfurase / selenocysteine lyase